MGEAGTNKRLSSSTPAVRDSARDAGCGMPRRSWLRRAVVRLQTLAFTVFGTVGGLWIIGIVRFLFPNVGNSQRRVIDVGRPEDYPPGYVETRYRDRYGVWIVRDVIGDRERIIALKARCTHLGCLTLWDAANGRFRCPCHGSVFSRFGDNEAGPAPRPLVRCGITLSASGKLLVDPQTEFPDSAHRDNPPGSAVVVDRPEPTHA
ncbi:MAG: hypothetical protein D6741_12830 [Planctomycetota bacterium]|nr:MAG: hypothetical protein D6741_12830 [Planctomycetota bacterium]